LGIEALHPDLFLLNLLKENPPALLDVLEKQAARFRKPPLSLQELLDGLARQTPLTFPVIFLFERSPDLPLSRNPILSLVIVIKIGLLKTEESLKPLFRRRFQT
jgi:hypothetical protein